MATIWQVTFYPQDVANYPHAYVLYSAHTRQAAYDFIDGVADRDDITVRNYRTNKAIDINELNGSWEVDETFATREK